MSYGWLQTSMRDLLGGDSSVKSIIAFFCLGITTGVLKGFTRHTTRTAEAITANGSENSTSYSLLLEVVHGGKK